MANDQFKSDLLFHVDNLFHTRVNFLLAVEALMFAGAGAVWNTKSIRLGVAVFGVVLSVVFFLLNLNLSRRLDWLMRKCEDEGPDPAFYKTYRDQGLLKWPRSIHLFTYALPGIALAGWLLVLFAT